MSESTCGCCCSGTSKSVVSDVLANYVGAGRDSLIPILQDIQDTVGYLSQEAVVEVGEWLNVPATKIFGVATFYNQFRFQPQGKYHVQVCRGTACHVKGSAAVQDAFERELDIKAGQTSEDGLFSIEVVACIGACGLAPVICVNGEFHAQMTTEKVSKLIKSCRQQVAEAMPVEEAA